MIGSCVPGLQTLCAKYEVPRHERGLQEVDSLGVMSSRNLQNMTACCSGMDRTRQQ